MRSQIILAIILVSFVSSVYCLDSKKGVSFVVLGDFANALEMKRPNVIFDAINLMKKQAQPGSSEDFDFFTTVGDNLYPHIYESPTEKELDDMMRLFLDREYIKDLPIYPVRGNHDCYFDDMDLEIALRDKYPTWNMENHYYEKQFPIGTKGEKFSLLQVDSCFLLCETIGKSKNKQQLLRSLDPDSKGVFQSRCEGDQTYVVKGDQMMKWLDIKLEEIKNDDKIIWRASGMHHCMFGLHYEDYQAIIDDFLPKINNSNFDVFFNGHEHLQNYAYLDKYQQVPQRDYIDGIDCSNSTEWINNPQQDLRKYRSFQGEKIHQFTLGAAGKSTYLICESNKKTTKGNFIYGENMYNGFGLVTVTENEFKLQIKGINYETGNDKTTVYDLFEVSIYRKSTPDHNIENQAEYHLENEQAYTITI